MSELEIVREGESIILRPVRPTWGSYAQLEKTDPDCICSFIMREQPEALLKHLEQAVLRGHRIVVSAIT